MTKDENDALHCAICKPYQGICDACFRKATPSDLQQVIDAACAPAPTASSLEKQLMYILRDPERTQGERAASLRRLACILLRLAKEQAAPLPTSHFDPTKCGICGEDRHDVGVGHDRKGP